MQPDAFFPWVWQLLFFSLSTQELLFLSNKNAGKFPKRKEKQKGKRLTSNNNNKYSRAREAQDDSVTLWLRDRERNLFALIMVAWTCVKWQQINVLMDCHFYLMRRSWAEASAFLRADRKGGTQWGKLASFFPWVVKGSSLKLPRTPCRQFNAFRKPLSFFWALKIYYFQCCFQCFVSLAQCVDYIAIELLLNFHSRWWCMDSITKVKPSSC